MRVRNQIKRRFPEAYGTVRQAAEPLLREVRFLSKVGLGVVIRRSVKKTPWQSELPLQSRLRVDARDLTMATLDELRRHLDERHVQYAEGAHTIYLSPLAVAQTAFAAVSGRYPPGVGLKIVKNPLESGQSQYIHKVGQSRIHRAVTYSPKTLILAANLLHLYGIGPRLYDFVELGVGDSGWVGYVVAHCAGPALDLEECQRGVRRIAELQHEGLITIIAPGGFGHPDFTCPACGGNALADTDTGSFQYVDFQNFLLENYERFLSDLGSRAGRDTHFGDETVFRGGRYLYQSIPGLDLPAKRSTEVRASFLRALLDEAHVSLHDRIVLDYGCNLGMMMGQYLKLGARWCHGWDFPPVVAHAERLLLAMGCTRFSVAGVELSQGFEGTATLPAFLAPALPGCVVSYLAMRRHIGWADDLSRLPWHAAILEGHEDEPEPVFLEQLHELGRRVRFRVGARKRIKDGDSGERFAAVLVRQGDVPSYPK